MNNYERAKEDLRSCEGSAKGVHAEIARVVTSVDFEVDEEGEEDNEKVLNFVFLFPMSKMIIISYPKPVAEIHQKITK